MKRILIKLGLLLGIALLLIVGSYELRRGRRERGEPADLQASPETRALLNRLLAMQGQGVMFGHEDSLAYGIGWWGGEFESDIEMVSGKFPAVFGWDAGKVGEEYNIDGVPFTDMQNWMIEVHERGGINTLSWHLDNPVSGGDTWDTTSAVHEILPGGKNHAAFKESLDQLAHFLKGIKTDDGIAVPILFRPWHEQNGGWFWWGASSCSPKEYKQLFRFTVEYLTVEKQIHQLLFCYSPNVVRSKWAYLKRYPGDDFVDVLGVSDYKSFAGLSERGQGFSSLKHIAWLAEKKQKPFALAETGVDGLEISDWWTVDLLAALKNNPDLQKLSYVLVWRNDSVEHYFAPYPGHVAADDFVKFAEDPYTLFLDDLTE